MTALVAAVFGLGFAWRALTFSGFQNDHFVHLSRAQQLILGDVPIRDFVDPGMPLMYLVSAAAWALWGGSPGTELCVIAAAFALAASCTFAVAHRLGGSMFVAIAAAVLEVLITPRTYSYPKVLVYAAAAWAIVAVAESPSHRRVLLLAGSAAVAFLFRHDHGLYVGIAGAVAVALATLELGWRAAARRVAIFAAALLLCVSPWLAFVAYYQGVADYFASSAAFSRAEATRNGGPLWYVRFTLSPNDLIRVRPPYRPSAIVEWKQGTPNATRHALEAKYGLEAVPSDHNPPREYYGHNSSPAMMRALANEPHVADVSGLDRFIEWTPQRALLARLSPWRLHVGSGWHVDGNSYVWLFYVFRALPIACAVILWRRRRSGRERWRGESVAIVSLMVLAVLVNIGLLRGRLDVWLPDAIVPAVLLGAWLVPQTWNAALMSPWSIRLIVRTVLTLGLALTVGAISVVGDVRERINRSQMRSGLSGVRARVVELQSRLSGTYRDVGPGMWPSSVSEALLPFFAYLQRCTSADDRLLMTHLYPDVYVTAGRGFAGGHEEYREAFYTTAADQEKTLLRLRGQSVPFVLLIRGQEFRDNFYLLTTYIDARYERLASVVVEETETVRVLIEKDRTAARVDPETGWPCFK